MFRKVVTVLYERLKVSVESKGKKELFGRTVEDRWGGTIKRWVRERGLYVRV